ncbi:hypothetical protein DL96DRAFT_1604348 [Flagelloscypha sp. PMI_526]|nr:hypothetical protein DL96DRAFT_1604348 [Flagelloscypha sp. PMI_526]
MAADTEQLSNNSGHHSDQEPAIDNDIPQYASFVVYFPTGHFSIPVNCQISRDSIQGTWSHSEDQIIKSSSFDSKAADEWIDQHPDLQVVCDLHAEGVQGPLGAMLDIRQPALTIFSEFFRHPLKLAQMLADQACFPVMVLPLTAYPMSVPVANGTQQCEVGSINSVAPITLVNHTPSPVLDELIVSDSIRLPSNLHSTSPPPTVLLSNMDPTPLGGPVYHDGGGEPVSDTANTAHPVCHSVTMEVSLRSGSSKQQETHAFRLDWSLQVYPRPNLEIISKSQKTNFEAPKRMVFQDEMGAYVHVNELSASSIDPYAMYSRFEFHDQNIQSEFTGLRPISYGYHPSQIKRKAFVDDQRGRQKSMLPTLGKETIEEYQVTPDWLVKEGDFIASAKTAFFRQFNIWKSNCINTTRPKLEVEFGMYLSPLSKPRKQRSLDLVRPSCLYVHQLHVWVGSKRPRGMIFVLAHHLPDLCTSEASSVVGSDIIEVEFGPIQTTNPAEEQLPSLILTNPEEPSGLASATTHSASLFAPSSVASFSKPHQESSQVAGELVCLTSMGWDHTTGNWLDVQWPYLGSKLEVLGDDQELNADKPPFN